MPSSVDLIDFEVIENQKENIQSIPGGHSARTLAKIFSPPLKQVPTPCDTKSVNDAARKEYESELENISESDDPLDIYDRYIRWTLDAYPSAQVTASSYLLPLLERATKAFVNSAQYKNDPRYLKLWILYIRLVSDAPRETFSFLARHNIGEYLALFYEEFAAWLESAGRWKQADEIFRLGIDKEARPTARLLRKFNEFQIRFENRPLDLDQPSSPALPTVRPALTTKLDPFAPIVPEDPQARLPVPEIKSITRKRNPKLQIFSDKNEIESSLTSRSDTAGWQTIGSISERKKENVLKKKPWVGQTLNAKGTEKSHAKLCIYKDQPESQFIYPQITDPIKHQTTVNQKGKKEHIFVNLEALYPTPQIFGSEMSLEELRANHRGWLSKNWVPEVGSKNVVNKTSNSIENFCENNLYNELNESVNERLIVSIPLPKEPYQDGRARRMKIKEVNETQIIRAKLSSPAGRKMMRRKSKEQTMTIHTKAATDEIYSLFNKPLQDVAKTDARDDSLDEDDMTDGDYTSGGESTETGKLLTVDEDENIDETSNLNSACEFSELPLSQHISDLQNKTDDLKIKFLEDEEEFHAARNQIKREQSVTLESSEFSTKFESKFLQRPSNDHEVPTQSFRDSIYVSQNRLPFMTPIAEKTESSIGAATSALTRKNSLTMKTPSKAILEECMKESEHFPKCPTENFPAQYSETERLVQPIANNIFEANKSKLVSPKISNDNTSFFMMITTSRAIIKDRQCNPTSHSIHKSILASLQPSLDTYEGFFDHSDIIGARTPDIRKYIKALGKSHRKGPEKTLNTQVSPILRFPRTEKQYVIRRELGEGTFAPVYLVEVLQLGDEDKLENNVSDQLEIRKSTALIRRGNLQALKMERTPSVWEFYIMRQARYRLGDSRAAQSITNVYEMHLYKDESYLIEEFREQGTLLNVINIVKKDKSGSGVFDESLAMFFSIELFRTIEELHVKGILHGDLKADNCLVRFDPLQESDNWSSCYRRDGLEGWDKKGISLIDFGRGIDMYVFDSCVQFIADWESTPQDCPEIRDIRPWTYQIDYYGVADIIHSMLFGKYIETLSDNRNDIGPGARKTWRLKENLKRYWNTEIWTETFDILLNPTLHVEGESDGKMPITRSLRACREKMELWLEANNERGVGLQAMIRKLESVLAGRR